jgi:hypothetical protein
LPTCTLTYATAHLPALHNCEPFAALFHSNIGSCWHIPWCHIPQMLPQVARTARCVCGTCAAPAVSASTAAGQRSTPWCCTPTRGSSSQVRRASSSTDADPRVQRLVKLQQQRY